MRPSLRSTTVNIGLGEARPPAYNQAASLEHEADQTTCKALPAQASSCRTDAQPLAQGKNQRRVDWTSRPCGLIVTPISPA